MKKLSGVYCIENIESNKKYIGQTIDLHKRKLRHFSKLSRNNHQNKRLQNSYNKHGEKVFKFKVLIYCEPFELSLYEQFFVNLHSPEILYNIRLECINSNLGMTHSEKSKQKMSGTNNHNYGKPMSEEQKRKISNAQCGEKNHMYGKKLSEEHKEKISNALKGEKAYWYGKKLSPETREKLSRSHMGKIASEETRRKISKAKIGKTHSEETKKRLSENRLGENNPHSKLTKKEVLEIYKCLENENFSQNKIAKNYNVSPMTISSIKSGKRWGYLYDNLRKEV